MMYLRRRVLLPSPIQPHCSKVSLSNLPQVPNLLVVDEIERLWAEVSRIEGSMDRIAYDHGCRGADDDNQNNHLFGKRIGACLRHCVLRGLFERDTSDRSDRRGRPDVYCCRRTFSRESGGSATTSYSCGSPIFTIQISWHNTALRQRILRGWTFE